jgi:hypothetical protein
VVVKHPRITLTLIYTIVSAKDADGLRNHLWEKSEKIRKSTLVVGKSGEVMGLLD